MDEIRSTGGLVGSATDDMLCLQQLLKCFLSKGMLILIRVQLFSQSPKVLCSLVPHHLLHSRNNQLYRCTYKLVYQKHLLLIIIIPSIIISIISVSSILTTISISSINVLYCLFFSLNIDRFFHLLVIIDTTTTTRALWRTTRGLGTIRCLVLPITCLLHLNSSFLKELFLFLLIILVS